MPTLVVVATPWDGAVATVKPLAAALAGKVVVSMANALVKEGREFLALMPPRGSVAATLQAVLPESLVSASFHHLPASEMEKLDTPVAADVLVCSDHPEATEATVALVDRIDGLRGSTPGASPRPRPSRRSPPSSSPSTSATRSTPPCSWPASRGVSGQAVAR